MSRITQPLIAAIMVFADAQRGLITHEQLIECGLDRSNISRLCQRGWLRRIHRGVYLVGHAAPQPWVRETAAVFSLKPNALIVARSALVVWGARKADQGLPVHVGVVGRKVRSRTGITVHQIAHLDRCDVTHHERLPITSVARSTLDAAHDLGFHETERVIDEAIALGLITRPALLRVTERYPGHRGAAIIRALADPRNASEITASEAEAAYAKSLRIVKAPTSQTQYPIGPFRADRCWPELMLVVEIDGTQFHSDRKKLEEDNARQDFFRHQGYVTKRFTRRQVVYDPQYVMFRTGQEIGIAQAAAKAQAAQTA